MILSFLRYMFQGPECRICGERKSHDSFPVDVVAGSSDYEIFMEQVCNECWQNMTEVRSS